MEKKTNGGKGEQTNCFKFLGISDRNDSEKLQEKRNKFLVLHVCEITFSSLRKIIFQSQKYARARI